MDYINKIKNVLSNEQFELLYNVDKVLKQKMPAKLYLHSIGTLNFSVKLLLRHYPGIFSGKAVIEDEVEISAVDKKTTGDENLNAVPGSDFLYIVCIASILHDYGKILAREELVRVSLQCVPGLTDFEKTCHPCLHGFIAPYLIKRDFGIEDKDVLQAIRLHTIGSCNMSLADRIVYISDKLEAKRNYENIGYLRELSMRDLDLCLLEVYKSNIIYIINKNYTLHPETSRIWNYICGGYKNVT